MIKLIKLELRKFRIISYIPAAIIANIMIFAFSFAMSSIPEIRDDMSLTKYNELFMFSDTLVRATYIVFASVLLSKLVIGEFRSKTISVLFMYPINRKKLIIAKLLIVVLFTLMMSITANVFVGACLYISNHFTSVVQEPLTWQLAVKSLLKMAMSGLAISFLGLIPLYFGMRKYSVPTTIVSSILVAALVCQNINGFTLYSVIAVPISLALIGAAISYWSIRKIEQIDVLQ
ncbi:ABC transporter permease [Paenibacillus xylaniclasticus]|uniref:ABC transporter permease n=1 Tax=Paenibacillus xylaniclasticus TaxID=588083 RepID=UPI00177934F6|nr:MULTISPECIES: ABC transporter permease [Paenibacillus]GFN33472.1 bacitracin ABC transporter permease [Paenibacillus curdlanolyticus]